MLGSDRRPHIEASLDYASTSAGRSTLPPPDWTARRGNRSRPPIAGAEPLPRRSGLRAEEAWLRGRLRDARALGDKTTLRSASIALARYLAARERDIDEAIELSGDALALEDDPDLRREASAWLESLGDPARAAAVLRPVACRPDLEAGEVIQVFIKAGILKARAGAAAAAAALFESAMLVDPDDSAALELFGALGSWHPAGVAPKAAAQAYVESARRSDRAGRHGRAIDSLWRALAVDPTCRDAVTTIAETLEAEGDESAADQVWAAYARAIAGSAPEDAAQIHTARRTRAQAKGDVVTALGAALDQGLDEVLGGDDAEAFDGLLLDAGLADVVAARLEARAKATTSAQSRGLVLAELGRLSGGALADRARAVSAFAAALAADPSCEPARKQLRSLFPELRRGDAAHDRGEDALETLLQGVDRSDAEPGRAARILDRLGQAAPKSTPFVGPPEDAAPSRAAHARAWVHASLAHDTRQQALWLERVAELAGPSLRSMLLAAAAERLLVSGDPGGARRIAEKACLADDRCLAAVVVLADSVVGHEDSSAAKALTRAIVHIGPRFEWVFSLSHALSAQGDSVRAIATTRRALAVAPGDPRAIAALLERLAGLGDAIRLADALARLLVQPLPIAAIAAPFAATLRELARLDLGQALVVGRRALDVFGPKMSEVREALVEAATRAGDVPLVAAVYERWASSQPQGPERKEVLERLADVYERLGLLADEARIVARAARDGCLTPEIDRHLVRLLALDLPPDAHIGRLAAQVERSVSRSENDAAAHAARQLGAALWDTADDRVGALSAWERAARLAGAGGFAVLALDLAAFVEPAFAFEYLARRVDTEPDDRGAAAIAADGARAALVLGHPLAALDLARKGVVRCPSWADALELAEAAAQGAGAYGALSGVYDLLVAHAMGSFGKRSAHYRAARFFERRGESALAFRHAMRALASLPYDGATLRLVTRTASGAQDLGEALDLLQRLAQSMSDPQVRSVWLLRAAEVAARGGDVERRVDALLQAVASAPSSDTIRLLREATEALVAAEPDGRDVIELRLDRLARDLDGKHPPLDSASRERLEDLRRILRPADAPSPIVADAPPPTVADALPIVADAPPNVADAPPPTVADALPIVADAPPNVADAPPIVAGPETARDEERERFAERIESEAEALAVLENDPVVQSDAWIEAALTAARAGDLQTALANASRGAEVAPHRATPQLLARGLEYRLKGAGDPVSARRTVESLRKISEPIGADDVALRAFLIAEALDVMQGPASALAELHAARQAAGDHPLVALGLAERLAQRGDAKAASDLYAIALSGPLLGLRSPALVALAAADCAVRGERLEQAMAFLTVAERHDETREGALERRRRIEQRPTTAALAGPEPSRELVRHTRREALDAPGAQKQLEALRDAASADGDDVYALAIEHVLRAFGPEHERIAAPPLDLQPEQPGIFALLTRPSSGNAGEILKLLWEGGAQLFARDAASYAVTGVERVVPGSASPLARLYELAIRALDAPRIPLFVSKTPAEQLSAHVALLLPPSVILSGPVREDLPALRFELGRGMSAALPQNVLRLGLPGSEGQSVLDALLAAFGPPEYGPHVQGRAAQLAQAFWQLMPARMQRRFAQLLAEAPLPEYATLVESAYQSGRRVGMFLSGDFRLAVETAVAETSDRAQVTSLSELPALCREVPWVADLVELAISPEYAHARWHTSNTVARGPYTSGRFSLF